VPSPRWKLGLLSMACGALMGALGGPMATSCPGQQGGPAGEPPAPRTITDPGVRALLDSHPQTPDELLRVTLILIDRQHAWAAKPLLERLNQMNLDHAVLAGMVRRYGSGAFLRLSLVDDLQPDGGALADRALEAARTYYRDPQRLQQWIEQLKDPSPQSRALAIMELRYGGSAAVNALLGVLADASRADEHPMIRTALVGQRSNAVEPLIAALQTANDALRLQVIDVLGQLNDSRAAVYLLSPLLSGTAQEQQAASTALQRLLGTVPSLDDARSFLYYQARRHYAGLPPAAADMAGMVEVWLWDDTRYEALPQQFEADLAAQIVAQRLSGELRRAMPGHRAVERLYLGSALQRATLESGLQRALRPGDGGAYAEAQQAGVAAVLELLEESLDEQRTVAVLAALRVLGEIGDESLLHVQAPRVSPLVRAVAYPDRRVSFAALEAVMKLAPQRPYAGSSQVGQALGFFASGQGLPRVLVVHPHPQEAQRIAALAAQNGFATDIASDARSAIRQSAQSPDYALVLVDYRLPNTNLDVLIQQLRRDRRAGSLAVGILAPLEQLPQAERLVRMHDRCGAFLPPRTMEALSVQANVLLGQYGRDVLSPQERIAQAAQALRWLAALAAEPQSLYDLRRYSVAVEQSLHHGELSLPAITAAGALGTPSSQRALAALASRTGIRLEVRQAAVEALGQSVQRYGILLTSGEILRQYDLYNASQNADEDTQQVLGAILDVLESRVQRAAPAQPPASGTPTPPPTASVQASGAVFPAVPLGAPRVPSVAR
jgi:CheY-like chemotaxis protein